MDTKRKGRKMYCQSCRRTTAHLPAGQDDKDVREINGKTKVSKVVYFMCSICGDYHTINRY